MRAGLPVRVWILSRSPCGTHGWLPPGRRAGPGGSARRRRHHL